MRVLGVSAVADCDERHDDSPDIGTVAPERRVVTAPDTRDDYGDRLAAPTMIACPFSVQAGTSSAPRDCFLCLRLEVRDDLRHRCGTCTASADAKASIDPIACVARSWGPDRFYIELVSRATLARFGFHTRRSPLPAYENPTLSYAEGTVAYETS